MLTYFTCYNHINIKYKLYEIRKHIHKIKKPREDAEVNR